MRLSYLLELVLAVCVGLGLARYRLTGPELADTLTQLPPIYWYEEGIDSFLAGMALVGGLGTLIERARGKSPAAWGPGRWAWASLAIYLVIHLLEWTAEITAQYNQAIVANPRVGIGQNSLWEKILQEQRGGYSGLLLTSIPWFLLALGLTSLAAPGRRDSSPDAREWAGRLFAASIVAVAIGFTALLLLGFKPSGMGGGMGGG